LGSTGFKHQEAIRSRNEAAATAKTTIEMKVEENSLSETMHVGVQSKIAQPISDDNAIPELVSDDDSNAE
jgi:hypothetical protein